jgi:hypothetical protein
MCIVSNFQWLLVMLFGVVFTFPLKKWFAPKICFFSNYFWEVQKSTYCESFILGTRDGDGQH